MNTNNTYINNFEEITTPTQILAQMPLTNEDTVFRHRNEVKAILNGVDKRQMVVVGPCSIHDYDMALEYASRLKVLASEVQDKLLIVMRVYFEKPRTTVGWKGLINDPHLDGSFDIQAGLIQARRLMLAINDIGLPIATEALDPISPQYFGDLISWYAIGARTTESQTHREMASGLSAPVGFKNGTDGSIEVAINGMISASNSHNFLGLNAEGKISIVSTQGNPHTHLILRGSSKGENYNQESIKSVENALAKKNLDMNIIVDCSHDNCNKDYTKQNLVLKEVARQIKQGNTSLKGVMLESNINEGKQNLEYGHKDMLKYGVSITDGCISWAETEKIIKDFSNTL